MIYIYNFEERKKTEDKLNKKERKKERKKETIGAQLII